MPKRASDLFAIAALVVGYPVLTQLAYHIGPVGGLTTPVWPAAGLALAVLLLAGSRLWPALLVGATAAQVLVGRPPLSALLIGIGETLETMVAAWFTRRFALGTRAFEHLRSVLTFLLFAAVLTPILGATIAVVALGVRPDDTMMSVGRVWLIRWLGNTAGIMTVTPLMLLWATDPHRSWTWRALGERLLLFVALVGACEAVFGVPFGRSEGHAFTFLFSPILAWAAFRFRLRATALAVCITAAAAVWGTARGTSPFLRRDDVMTALLLLQVFSIAVAGTTFAVAAGMLELRRAKYYGSRATERARFLAEASHLLSASLDIEQTLPKLAALAVPRIADWSAVHTVDRDGALHEVALAHVDPQKVRDVHALFAHTVQDPRATRGIRKVIRTGEPDLIPDIPDEMLVEVAQSPEQLALLRSLGFKSSVCVPMRAGRRVLGTLTFVSTRAERRYDNADLHLAQELADRSAIAIENARLYAHAQEAVRIREDFLSIASHELRTPMTALRLQIKMLERALAKGPSDAANPRIGEHVRDLDDQGERLTRLVNGLFDVTAISAGKLDLDVTENDFRNIVQTTVHSLRPLAREHGVQITVDAPEPLPGRWDATRLTQVVANLVSNAIKYGDGKPVDVRLGATDSVVKLSVRDQGPGIPHAHRARIFERFERVPRASGPTGLGLGLYIVRQIVQAHGGKVELESQASGTVFTVTLPRWTSRRRNEGLHEALAAR